MTHWDSENTTAPHTARELGMQEDRAATALDALIEAVEAGTATKDKEGWMHLPMIPLGGGRFRSVMGTAFGAYEGSIDAAKALHDALLPGCSQYSIVTDPTCLCVKVAWWPNGLSGEACCQGEAWSEDNPARAWLLAILKALRADPAAGAKAREGRDG